MQNINFKTEIQMTDYASNFVKAYVPYEDWKADIEANGHKPMPTGMFLRYVMDKQGITQAALEKRMGLEKNGLSSSLNGNHLQGISMGAKMAHMSNMSESFWSQALTDSALVDSVKIDGLRDASTIRGKIRGDTQTREDRAADLAVLANAGVDASLLYADRNSQRSR
jgi:transcriptional regulator with XRE-family HTH domain